MAKTYDQMIEYIKTQAIEHKKADDHSDYEMVEIDTFFEIVKFAIAEGFTAEPHLLKFFSPYRWRDDEEDDENGCAGDLMEALQERFDVQLINKTLPEMTAALYRFWMKAFWQAKDVIDEDGTLMWE